MTTAMVARRRTGAWLAYHHAAPHGDGCSGRRYFLVYHDRLCQAHRRRRTTTSAIGQHEYGDTGVAIERHPEAPVLLASRRGDPRLSERVKTLMRQANCLTSRVSFG